MKTKLFFAAAGLLLACGIAAVSATPGAVPSVPQYGKFEASFTLPNQTGNPFDPAENDVQVLFTGPSRRSVATPAFWDGDRWRVRYAPYAPGAYRLSVRRGGAAFTPKDLTSNRFRCIPSSSPGFIRRDMLTAQRFVFSNGQTYFPLGMNVAWTGQKTGDYPEIFQEMGAAHMNWARVWMTFWDGKALDWSPDKAKNPPHGEFLLEAARRWDTIFDAAEQSGVYVQMTLQHHGQYTEKTDPNWRDNPFNTANGGFLAHPDDFFTDPEAKRLSRAKYRYIAARWGYSSHLLAFELFNEVQNIGEANSHFADVLAWHKEMAAVLRSVDVNHHLITTSYTSPGEPLSQIGLDFDQPHEYTRDLVSYFAALQGTDKPLFAGEWGPDDTKNYLTEQTLHDGLWASLSAPTAGAGQFWYWNAVIANNWWPQFASASGFQQALAQRAKESAMTEESAMTKVHVRLQTSGPMGDLSFAPTEGWSKATRDTVTLSSGGDLPDLSGVPSFIQGSNHRDMTPNPLTLVLECPGPCRLTVEFGTVAKAGAHPTLSVDGSLAAEMDFPAASANHDAGHSLSVDLVPGAHRVALWNTGTDWFVVTRFTVSGYAPPLAVLAKGNRHRVVFWAYHRDRTGTPSGPATLLLDSLAPGTYTARLWDCWAGRALPAVPVVRRGEDWEVALPAAALRRDVAGVIE